MDKQIIWMHGLALAPAVLMGVAALTAGWGAGSPDQRWRRLLGLSWLALASAVGAALAWTAWVWLASDASADAAAAGVLPPGPLQTVGLSTGVLAAAMALLVQFLGTVIAAYARRYLQGEPGQPRAVAALAAVLAAVQVLLLADHWLWLLVAWAAVGLALQPLLCFYGNRPFALLAAHKKRLADRLADVLLIAAGGLAWWAVGSGSLSALAQHLATQPASPALHASAVLLVLAVALRTALLPVHGWLIQVMEAPTPVSALLHAGVVNLGGFVLIRFAPLLEASAPARWLLVALGLATAVLAGLVMLTRISVKVRLAWSTVAQMGFMVLECGLGLYTLAALHLLGHSLYKAHAFLSASSAVRESRLQMLRGQQVPGLPSLVAAPLVAGALVAALVWFAHMLTASPTSAPAWPWWWSAVLALAWAPLLWLPAAGTGAATRPAAGAPWRLLAGLALVAGLTLIALAAHALGLGLQDRPDHAAGFVVMVGMATMYAALVTLQSRGGLIDGWRRWSYAGFYVDEFYTRLTLRLWPTPWAAHGAPAVPALHTPAVAAGR